MRLRLLRCIDHAKAKGERGEDLKKAIEKAEREIMRPGGIWTEEELHRDQNSHFLLRLAFCRTEELRRYFLSNEHELFKFRFTVKVGDVGRFLRENEMAYEPIPADELDDVRSDLQNVRRAVKGKDAGATDKEDHYKVNFEEVPDLVRGRRVLLRYGYAYVPQSELISIVGGQFRARLSKALADASRAWPSLQTAEADRLSAFLEHCSTQYMADDYSADKKAAGGPVVSLSQLPMLTKRSYPLCMEHLAGKLHDNGHLKHAGRLQLGLFLKGIGLSVDESLTYWRTHFLKSMPADKFDKEHKYSIRYNYGLEARRAAPRRTALLRRA